VAEQLAASQEGLSSMSENELNSISDQNVAIPCQAQKIFVTGKTKAGKNTDFWETGS
jgi:hypothetical protein